MKSTLNYPLITIWTFLLFAFSYPSDNGMYTTKSLLVNNAHVDNNIPVQESR